MAIDKGWKQLKADEMRMNPTPPEAMLWGMMKMSQIAFNQRVQNDENSAIDRLFECEFERQSILHGWIVDFFFAEVNLVIEVDGKYHESSKDSDAERDRILYEKHGICTLRFTSRQVYTECEEVMDKITGKIFDAYAEMAIHKYAKMDWKSYDYLYSLTKNKRDKERVRIYGGGRGVSV